ncbi:hypothetical protein Pelo_19736 [Pelomyxa schiedti]|nr:hypothetical protein Pelo_19736 [Pelomyxa schiedti]
MTRSYRGNKEKSFSSRETRSDGVHYSFPFPSRFQSLKMSETTDLLFHGTRRSVTVFFLNTDIIDQIHNVVLMNAFRRGIEALSSQHNLQHWN